MNVLQVAPYFPPYQGGQETHVKHLTTNLRERGHEVRVLTSEYPLNETPDMADVHRLPVKKRLLRNPIVSVKKEAFELFRWADIAHMHNEHAFISNIGALLGNNTGTPTVLTCHGQLSFGSPVRDVIETLYNRTIGARTLKTMDRVIALSESDKEYLASLGVDWGDVEVVPNAIELPERSSDQSVEQFRAQHDLESREVVLFVGPIVRRKSPETLLTAMPQVRADRLDTVAVFVGSGDHEAEIKRKARALDLQDAVRFTGYLADESLLAAYRTASVLAVPSISEGLPTTILEGMAHELPVVATNLDPIRDWFDDHALLVESDPDVFSDAIKRVLSNNDLASRLGTEGADLVRSQFTWDQVSADVSRVYAEVAGSTERTGEPEHISA